MSFDSGLGSGGVVQAAEVESCASFLFISHDSLGWAASEISPFSLMRYCETRTWV